MAKSNAVLAPNFGLYFDRPIGTVPLRGLAGGNNFRIREGKLNNLNLGWRRFESGLTLNGPVLAIIDFFPTTQNLPETLVFASATDLYTYHPETHSIVYITPIYNTGTAAASGTAVTGVGTSWAANVKPGDEICFISGGEQAPGQPWFLIDAVNNNTSLTLHATAGTISAHTYTIRKKFTGGNDTVWSYDTFSAAPTDADPAVLEDQLWLTNGSDPLVRWNGSDAFAKFPSVAYTKVGALRVSKNQLCLYRVTTSSGVFKPTSFVNSQVGDPKNFTTGLAAESKIHSGFDAGLTLEELGDNLVLYSKYHIILAQFVGDPIGWAFRTMSNEHGPDAQGGVSNFGATHEFVGRDTMYTFDGVNIKDTNGHVWREILRQMDPSRAHRVYNHFDEQNAEIIWSIPSTTDADTGNANGAPQSAYVEHYLESVPTNTPTPYSKRDFPFTASGFYFQDTGLRWSDLTQAWSTLNFRWNDSALSALFPINLAGKKDGTLWQFGIDQDANGVALPSFVQFGRRPTSDGVERGLLWRVYPFMERFAGLFSVTSFFSDFYAGPNTTNQTDTIDMTMLEGLFFVTVRRRGRYFQLQFGTPGPAMPWVLDGYDVAIRTGGKR